MLDAETNCSIQQMSMTLFPFGRKIKKDSSGGFLTVRRVAAANAPDGSVPTPFSYAFISYSLSVK